MAKHAERMLADPRAKAKVREFLITWLKLDQPKDLSKDAKRFPGFDAALARDLRTSLELFLDDVVWSEKSDFRQLFLADETLPQRPAREVLRRRALHRRTTDPAVVAAFTKVKFEADKRGRRADAPVHARVAGVRGGNLADPPRGVRRPRAARHPDQAAAGSVHAARARTFTRT